MCRGEAPPITLVRWSSGKVANVKQPVITSLQVVYGDNTAAPSRGLQTGVSQSVSLQPGEFIEQVKV